MLKMRPIVGIHQVDGGAVLEVWWDAVLLAIRLPRAQRMVPARQVGTQG